MQSFKSNILKKIEAIPEGKIFTFGDISFPVTKFANVAVILSNLTKENKLVRVERGAYYRPKLSNLGLGFLPVYQDEQFLYLTNKLNGYLTGMYIYNKMSLTEQVPATVTIASTYPVRAFKFKKLAVQCVKSYIDRPSDVQTLYLVQILDAVKDMQHIPGVTPQTAFDKINRLHVSVLSLKDQKKLVSLSLKYPPRVRKSLSDMMYRNNKRDLAEQLVGTICPTTRFNLSYKTVEQ
ncbi:MAG: DUF6088 family protein [Prevotellaceae bacterium]|jgi:predicted transcriptional regulator of viral defense system|nr:DUF6088 family protein [Prevotellaceae bacterium]